MLIFFQILETAFKVKYSVMSSNALAIYMPIVRTPRFKVSGFQEI